jgi:glucokinase
VSDLDVTVGIDIGGTNTTAGVISSTGQELALTRFPTDAAGGADGYVRRLALTIEELSTGLDERYTLRGIGIASPAANHHEGTIRRPANLPWGTINIVSMLKEYFDLPITVINDSNAAALGEMELGSAKGMRTFVVITLGTGLGAGLVVNGQLVHGETGAAGELGHITINPAGRECGCGRRGCVETYVSARGIRRTVFELLAQRTSESQLRTVSFFELSAERIFEFAKAGDAIAREAFEITGKHLGRMLTNIVAVLDPQAVILSGGLVNAGEMLLGPTRRAFESNVLDVYKNSVRIIQSVLPDGRAAVLGASSLVRASLQEGVPT